MGIGAGITNGSIPVEEWHESLLKGKFLTHLQQPFQLFETMLWEKERGFYLLEKHLSRLERGAEYFKFSYDQQEIKEQLLQKATHFSETVLRVRLVLEKDGQISITSTVCDKPSFLTLPNSSEIQLRPIGGAVRFSFASLGDVTPYIYHKTSRRTVYDCEFKNVLKRGETDVLFFNGNKELTEGSISNVVVFNDGIYSTPPVECGLLPGVMREQLLEKGNGAPLLVEKIISRQDVENADAVFICNSVRGVVRVKLLK